MKFFRFRNLLILGFIALIANCSSDEGITEPQATIAISMSPLTATMKVGENIPLATVVTANGTPITSQTISYISSAPSVVSVSVNGLLVALAPGNATITATASPSGKTASANITVLPNGPSTVAINAGNAQSANAGSAVSVAPSVLVKDAAGSPLAGAAVTFAVASGGGSITGASATTNASGIATVGSWVLGAGANTLTATVSGLPAVTFTATGIVVVPTAANVAINAGNLQTATVGTAVAIAPSVLVTTSTGQPVGGVTVTWAVASGGGTITGATTTTNASGIATLGSWTLGAAAGPNTLTASVAGLNPVTFTASATTPLPTIVLSSNNLTFNMTVGSGAVGQLVTVSSAGGTLGTLSVGPIVYGAGATNWLNAALVGTFAPTSIGISLNESALTTPGTYTATVPVLATGSSNSPQNITVTVVVTAPVFNIAITQQPVGTTSGVAFTTQPIVRITDAGGTTQTNFTGAVTASIATGTGALSGTTTVNAVNGVATFTNLRILGGGQFTLQFSAPGATAAMSNPITLAVPPATTLNISSQPGSAATNVTISPAITVQLMDANGNLVVNSSAPVSVALGTSPAGGAITGTTTVNAVNGVATFNNIRLTTPGTYTLVFSSAGVASATSTSIVVSASPPTLVSLLTNPAGAVTGSPLGTQPSVELRDATGARALSATNAVTATLNGSGGTLSGTTTVNAVNGVANFTNLTVTGAGTYTLTFSSPGLTAATSPQFTITPLPPTQLSVATQPVGGATGAQLTVQPSVQLRDANGTLVTGANNAVTATLVGAGGTLSGTATVNAVNGVATFTNLAVTGPGTYSLQFTSAGLTAAASNNFTVTNLPPSQLGITTQPVGGSTGGLLATQPVVQVRDANGAVVAGSTNNVTAALAAGSTGTLSGTTTVAAVNGVATFTDLKITGAGTSNIVFTSPGLTQVVSNAVTTAPLPATQLTITTQPGSAVSGSALNPQPVVRVADANGGAVAGAAVQVTAALNGAGGTLSGTQTVTSVNGVATFTNLAITGPGTYTLTFTSAGLTSATSANITINPTAPTQLGVATQPVGAVAGSALATQPVVQVRDVNGAVVTSSSAPVTATLVGAGGTLSGTTTVNAVNGVATFTNLSVNAAGTYTLNFTSPGLTSVGSAQFTMTAAPATKLGIQTQPGGAVTGSALNPQPVVQIQSANGVVVAGAVNSVTATLNGAGGTLIGTQTVNAVNGVATFTNLAVNGAGSYTLTFSSAGLTSVTSQAFTVQQGSIAFNIGASATASGVQQQNLSIPLIIDMTNAAGQNLATLQFNFNWDPTKFTFVGTTNGTFGTSSPTINTTQSANGQITVGFFDTNGFNSGTPTILTVTLKPIASATNSQVTAAVTLAADANGNTLQSPIVVRPLSVTTP